MNKQRVFQPFLIFINWGLHLWNQSNQHAKKDNSYIESMLFYNLGYCPLIVIMLHEGQNDKYGRLWWDCLETAFILETLNAVGCISLPANSCERAKDLAFASIVYPFPTKNKSSADEFEHILSKNRKSL